ncbi:MAG TPA: molybdenum cofactor biosynthesis protein MoaE [Solirubrobacterales bacterium]|nr:molybdenum cofactor biosynthesis protein MoaE [Solirubrobacterales bacterium]
MSATSAAAARTMTLRVRLFAVLRERAGRDELELELEESATVADALSLLSRQPPLEELLARLPVRLAVNRGIATARTPLRPGDELALIPPVSGGARLHARVSDAPLSPEAISRAVHDPRAGAIVVFQGVTREVERLEYEAYREMAEERIAAILAGCAERHDLLGAAAEHRVGAVPLGEPAVVVAVSAAHRGEAFAAAAEAIDAIKAEAPIWKREVDGGEARWAEGMAAPVAEERR